MMHLSDVDNVMNLLRKIVDERQRLRTYRSLHDFTLNVGGNSMLSGSILREEERKPGTQPKEKVQAVRDIMKIADECIQARINEAVHTLQSKFDIIVIID